jgi:ABC-type Mn2+/Zn2+ transport system permease subunit
VAPARDLVLNPVLALTPVEWVVDPFLDSVIMRRGLLAGTFAAVACGLVGTWVVLRGMTFLGDALAHGVLPGLALAAVIGFNPTLAALASAGVMIAGITVVGRRSRLPEDVAIGLLFVGMLAVGVLIVSSSRSFAGELTGFLFGGITSVTAADLAVGAAVAAGVVVLVVVGYRAFLALSFNRATAELLGLRPRLAHAVLLVMITFTVVASFKTVGTLLVFALITAPPAAATLWVRRVPSVLVLSVVLAEASVVVGLLVSWHARLAAGAAMATCAVAIFAVSLVASEVRRWFGTRSGAGAAVA